MTQPRRLGRPVGSDGAVTRARLLRSAREVFAERGYEKATPAAIAEGAGLTRTAFYHHFDSKTALFEAVLEDLNAMVIDELFGARAEHVDDPAERVARVFRASAEFNAGDRSYGRFLTTLLVEGHRDPVLRELAEAEVDRFRSFFAEAAHDAGAEDPDALVDLLVAVQWGLGLFAAFIGDADRLEAAIGYLTQLSIPGKIRSRGDDGTAQRGGDA
jgi:AcrR family transcriptional regulator